MKNKVKLIGKKINDLEKNLENCSICPRNCRVNRVAGQIGYCGAGLRAVTYTSFLHRGEEPAISGKMGSGTIFFSGCNLRCVYCQNHKFSHSIQGEVLTRQALCSLMLKLQKEGAHNLNLVTPAHFMPQILRALSMALSRGLNIPIVYNTSSYEKKEIIELLSGIVDIYLADLRYIDGEVASLYSNAKDYPFYAKQSILEMYKQQPEPVFDSGLLKEALVIRHLVLPGYIEESKRILEWIKKNTPNAILSLMFQYQPYHKAGNYLPINRTVSREEYNKLIGFLKGLDLNGWVQDLISEESLAGVHFKPSAKKS